VLTTQRLLFTILTGAGQIGQYTLYRTEQDVDKDLKKSKIFSVKTIQATTIS
jgi:hypothetical protein